MMRASILAVSEEAKGLSIQTPDTNISKERTVGNKSAEKKDPGAKEPSRVCERQRFREQADADEDVDAGSSHFRQ